MKNIAITLIAAFALSMAVSTAEAHGGRKECREHRHRTERKHVRREHRKERREVKRTNRADHKVAVRRGGPVVQ